MDSGELLKQLPAYGARRELITGKQSVSDIIAEILKAHQQFAGDYDKIALYFNRGTTDQICDALYRFCKSKIKYRMESEEAQTVKSPSAILAQGYGDCKHYASFTGGVLDALNRTGKRIDWHYRFASYNYLDRTPGHIFVVTIINGREKWIDPTPGAEDAIPVWVINKKIKRQKMALYKVSGIGDTLESYPVSDLLDSTAENQELYFAIQTLLKWGVMDVNGKISDKKALQLQGKISPADFAAIVEAYNVVRSAGIGGLFSTIWRGVKKVTLAVPRAAFLSLVAINAFGYAKKLGHSIWDANNQYTPFKDKLKTLWQDKLGGDWTVLQNAVKKGMNKKAILGAAPAVPAWVATASAVIVAIMPLVNAFLKAKQDQTGINYNIDPNTGYQYGDPAAVPGAGGFSMNNISPTLLIGGAAVIFLLMNKKRS